MYFDSRSEAEKRHSRPTLGAEQDAIRAVLKYSVLIKN